MDILYTLLVGLVIGALAKFIMPGKDPGGCVVTIIIGIVGSFIGKFIGRALGMYGEGDAAGWVMSLVGALLLLFLYRQVIGKRG